MIQINDTLSIRDEEIGEKFIRSKGPGGQNVNKVSSAVQLRFDARNSPSLPQPIRLRLVALAGSRITKDGVVVITANRHRTQDQNRREALDRLLKLIARAATVPNRRVATRPGKAARKRRADDKVRRGTLKRGRRRQLADD